MTRATFNAQMVRLSGLKFTPPDMTTHWEALQDMPELLLEAAVSKAQRESDEFPSPRMLRMWGDIVRPTVLPVGPEPDRSVPADARDVTLPTGKVIRFEREWSYYCDDCSDIGWASYACGPDDVQQGKPGGTVTIARAPWSTSRACGRDTEHLPHGWSEPCHCVDWNQAVKRKREKAIQMAAQRVKARGDA